MDTNNLIYYTDGHQVMITNDGFRVKGTLYRLSAITQHGLSIIRPQRIPTIVLMVFGIALFLSGALNMIPTTWNTHINLLGFSVLVNSLLMAGGIALLGIGVTFLIIQKEKFSVRILTEEGEKNVVISHSREYISQIVDGLNRAYLDRTHKPENMVKKQFQVLG
jgi:uncharacterized membrane protein